MFYLVFLGLLNAVINQNYMYEGLFSLHPHDHHLTTQTIYTQLESWLQQGKQGMQKLRNFLYYEVDEELLQYAQMLYREALVSHFMPETQKEIQEFVLSRLISERKAYIADQEIFLKVLKEELIILQVQYDVDKEVLGCGNEDMLVSDEVIEKQHEQIDTIKQEIKEVKHWIESAKQFIEDERYINPPGEMFSCIDVESKMDEVIS